MKIGYLDNQYYNKRNIIGIVPGARYVQLNDANKILRRVIARGSKILGRRMVDTTELALRFTDFDINRVDLVHCFNAISFGRTPWITTFETIVPRYRSGRSCHFGRNCDFSPLMHEPKVLKALKVLSRDPCMNLIALSECNRNMQVDFLGHFPDYRHQIERKLITLHPPQHLLVEAHEHKKVALNEQIRFMFVGNMFFTKGGVEILESFQQARKESGHDLKLIIVSSLLVDDYATKATKADVTRVKALIDKNRDWVDYSERLPNHQVLELMQSAHVGLLPTYADTYGYSVLEFQAAGCPVISTNIRALPEINDNEMGWMIEIPKNRLGEAIYTTPADRAEISGLIRKGLTRAIADIVDNRHVIHRKSDASLKHIRDQHSPVEFARRLGELYRQALI